MDEDDIGDDIVNGAEAWMQEVFQNLLQAGMIAGAWEEPQQKAEQLRCWLVLQDPNIELSHAHVHLLLYPEQWNSLTAWLSANNPGVNPAAVISNRLTPLFERLLDEQMYSGEFFTFVIQEVQTLLQQNQWGNRAAVFPGITDATLDALVSSLLGGGGSPTPEPLGEPESIQGNLLSAMDFCQVFYRRPPAHRPSMNGAPLVKQDCTWSDGAFKAFNLYLFEKRAQTALEKIHAYLLLSWMNSGAVNYENIFQEILNQNPAGVQLYADWLCLDVGKRPLLPKPNLDELKDIENNETVNAGRATQQFGLEYIDPNYLWVPLVLEEIEERCRDSWSKESLWAYKLLLLCIEGGTDALHHFSVLFSKSTSTLFQNKTEESSDQEKSLQMSDIIEALQGTSNPFDHWGEVFTRASIFSAILYHYQWKNPDENVIGQDALAYLKDLSEKRQKAELGPVQFLFSDIKSLNQRLDSENWIGRTKLACIAITRLLPPVQIDDLNKILLPAFYKNTPVPDEEFLNKSAPGKWLRTLLENHTFQSLEELDGNSYRLIDRNLGDELGFRLGPLAVKGVQDYSRQVIEDVATVEDPSEITLLRRLLKEILECGGDLDPILGAVIQYDLKPLVVKNTEEESSVVIGIEEESHEKSVPVLILVGRDLRGESDLHLSYEITEQQLIEDRNNFLNQTLGVRGHVKIPLRVSLESQTQSLAKTRLYYLLPKLALLSLFVICLSLVAFYALRADPILEVLPSEEATGSDQNFQIESVLRELGLQPLAENDPQRLWLMPDPITIGQIEQFFPIKEYIQEPLTNRSPAGNVSRTLAQNYADVLSSWLWAQVVDATGPGTLRSEDLPEFRLPTAKELSQIPPGNLGPLNSEWVSDGVFSWGKDEPGLVDSVNENPREETGFRIALQLKTSEKGAE